MNEPADHHEAVRLTGRRLLIARMVWILVTLPSLLIPVFTLPSIYRLLLQGDPRAMLNAGWTEAEVNSALAALGISRALFAAWFMATGIMLLLIFWVVGFLIVWRKSDEAFGLFAAYMLLGVAGIGMYGGTGLGELSPLMTRIFAILETGPWTTIFIFMLIFPDGRFVPRWTRWVAGAWIVTAALLLDYGREAEKSIPAVLLIIAMGLFAASTLSQVYRYRVVSGFLQRLQARWVMFTMVLMFVVSLLNLTVPPLVMAPAARFGPLGMLYEMVWNGVLSVVLGMLPVSIAIAIFRYRLWDIDILIRRTLIYSTITVVLALTYFGGVAVMQSAFVALTGQESPLAVVASTLAIAALFTPVRRRVQDVVDRRFYRRKYDAAQTVDQFARAVRDEVDVDRLRGELVRVVETTMQPASVSLWLREK